MYRKSRRAKLLERKRSRARVMRDAKARKRMATPSEPWTPVGYIRACGPMFGGVARQISLWSNGELVRVDGGGPRTARGFMAAVNRKLWRAVNQAKGNKNG